MRPEPLTQRLQDVALPVGSAATPIPTDPDGMPQRGRRLWRVVDRAMGRVEDWARAGRWGNPLAEAGAAADLSLVVAILTGILLLFWYVPSQSLAHASVVGMGARSLGGILRSLHRYSSDAAVGFILWHALRTLAQRRATGPRWLAWVSGVFMLGLVWSIGWTGYWLVWDQRGRRIAEATARVLDAAPFMVEPLERSFLTSADLRGLLFFLVFFLHMIVPLAIGIGLWFHLARLRRSKFWPSKPVLLWLSAVLVLVSIVVPADVGPVANLGKLPGRSVLDVWYVALLPVVESVSGGLFLVGSLGLAALATAVPWLLRRRPAAAVKVDTARCNACEQCVADCPYGAMQMVPRTDGRRFPSQAEVMPSRCVRCGICVGSCSGGGVDLPWWSEARAWDRIARWLEASSAEGEGGDGVHIGFVCSEVLAGGTRIDPLTGALEGVAAPRGWRFIEVPCAGWLRAPFIARALKRGARSVAIVSCHEDQCRFREGPQWLAARFEGERQPSLAERFRSEARVRIVRTAPGAIGRALRSLRAPHASSSRPAWRDGLRAAVAAVLAVAALAWTGAAPVDRAASREPQLIVTFRLPGQLVSRCRKRTPEELAKLPPHMRTPEVCTRGRSPVRLRVAVDGREAYRGTFEPSGLWHDGTSVGIVPLHVAPGRVVIDVALDDTGAEPPSYPLHAHAAVDVPPASRTVLSYDTEHGFRLVHPDGHEEHLAGRAEPAGGTQRGRP